MDMTKDKALEELFLAQKPQFTDNADFMAALTKRLDAVEFIKQHQEATIRRYKMVVAAFVVGIISGSLAIALVLSSPAEPLFTFSIQSAFLLWVAENSRLIVATAIALLMTIGTISIIGNVQDIQRMRSRIKMDMTCC